MIETLLQPLEYGYMVRAILASALVGGVCAFLSAFLMLKGWSLLGDALAHCVVPGVAIAYLMRLPFAVGALVSGILAALAMALVRARSPLREDVVIGIVFTTFLAAGLLIVSMNPTSIRVETIILGNILAITDEDLIQVVALSVLTLVVLLFTWRDLVATFFDESHARSIGIATTRLKILFLILLSAAIVGALQAVGAALVVAMVITPGATAHLLADRFPVVARLAAAIGATTGALGAYISYFADGATGGIIVLLQTAVFVVVLIVAPRYGLLAARQARRLAATVAPEPAP